MTSRPKVISLFSGAGGLDVGFKRANFNIVLANDFFKDAVATYKENIGNHIIYDDIKNIFDAIEEYKNGIDVVIGGPPCQGFSVAGKMDPSDGRSQMIWEFIKVLNIVKPKIFVMENVKALGSLEKWSEIRKKLLLKMKNVGYSVNYIIVNASDYGVPQSRERVFFVGFYNKLNNKPDLEKIFSPFKEKSKTVKEILSALDKVGTGNNTSICKAKITLTDRPVMRRSPYAGMLFNGLGRPININGYCATLPASMGGNKTPIIDSEELYEGKSSWVEEYHQKLLNEEITPEYKLAPSRLRRLTVEEAALIQTFPLNYKFCGSQSSKYTQIGNAVPCELGYKIAQMVHYYLEKDRYINNYPIINIPEQLELV